MNRNPQLDLLRGLAVLGVMFHHYRLKPWFAVGSFGVDLFFVLSGFLISGLLFTDWKRNWRINLGRFYIRRAFKIYPAFYTLTAVSIPVLFIAEGVKEHPLRHLLGEITFTQNYLPHVWGHTWSLAVEEQFYLLLPLLLIALTKLRPVRPFAAIPAIAIGLFVLCAWFRQHPTHGIDPRFAFHCRADGLFAGVALGYLFHFERERFYAWSKWWFLPAAFASLFLGSTTAAGAFLVWWAVRREWLRVTLIERIGVYSYSIYLWHYPLSILFNREHPHWFLLPLYIAASLVVGICAAHVVEMPALALRNRLFPDHGVLIPSAKVVPADIPLSPLSLRDKSGEALSIAVP